jgi:hypothetical protein
LSYGIDTIGVGDTEEETEDSAIVEWAQYVAFGLVATLDFEANSGIPFEGFVAFPGATGIRGSQVNLPKHVDIGILGHLKALAKTLRSPGSELHSILIMVGVSQGKVLSGECRGTASSRLRPNPLFVPLGGLRKKGITFSNSSTSSVNSELVFRVSTLGLRKN